MKKSILVFFVCVSLFAFPFVSYGKSISNLKVLLSDDINTDCWAPSLSNTVNACHYNDHGTDKIFIRKDLPAPLLGRVLLKSIGHYLISDINDEDLNKLFVSPLSWMPIKETVADGFVLWFYGVKMTTVQDAFFKSLLTN